MTKKTDPMIQQRGIVLSIAWRHSLAVRAVALGTIFAFLLTSVSGTQAWAVNAIEVVAPRPMESSLSSLPSNLGRLREYQAPQGQSPTPFIVHIQDAHSNPSAQKNIAQILKWISAQSQDAEPLVALEGVKGALHPEYLNFFPEHPKTNEALVQQLLEKGELTGAELFAWETMERQATSNKRRAARDKQRGSHDPRPTTHDLRFVGVEEPALYRENLTIYREFLEHETQIKTELSRLRRALHQRENNTLSKEAREYLREKRRRKEGEYQTGHNNPQWEVYLGYLKRTLKEKAAFDLESSFEQIRFPNMVRLEVLIRAFKDLDLAKAEKEKETLLKKLESKIRTPQDKQTLMAFRERSNGVDLRESAEQVWALARSYQMNPKIAAEFWRMTGRDILQAELDVTALDQEMTQLEGWLEDSLADSDAAKKIFKLGHAFDRLEKMLSLELTAGQLEGGRQKAEGEREKGAGSESFFQEVLASIPRFAELSGGLSDLSSSRRRGSESMDSRQRGNDKTKSDIQKSLTPWVEKARRFYELAGKRDEVLLDNTLAEARGKKTVVLITGGFHTEGFIKRMSERGIGYAVIQPQMEVTGEDLYRKVLREENADVSAYFTKPVLNKQEALFFKTIVETGASELWEKDKVPHQEIAAEAAEALRAHPVLKDRLEGRAVPEGKQGSRLELRLAKAHPASIVAGKKASRVEAVVVTPVTTGMEFFDQLYSNGQTVPDRRAIKTQITYQPAGTAVLVQSKVELDVNRSEMRAFHEELLAFLTKKDFFQVEDLVKTLGAMYGQSREQIVEAIARVGAEREIPLPRGGWKGFYWSVKLNDGERTDQVVSFQAMKKGVAWQEGTYGLLVSEEGDVLLQEMQREPKRSDISAAGHVELNQTPQQAALAELEEELKLSEFGVQLTEDQLINIANPRSGQRFFPKIESQSFTGQSGYGEDGVFRMKEPMWEHSKLLAYLHVAVLTQQQFEAIRAGFAKGGSEEAAGVRILSLQDAIGEVQAQPKNFAGGFRQFFQDPAMAAAITQRIEEIRAAASRSEVRAGRKGWAEEVAQLMGVQPLSTRDEKKMLVGLQGIREKLQADGADADLPSADNLKRAAMLLSNGALQSSDAEAMASALELLVLMGAAAVNQESVLTAVMRVVKNHKNLPASVRVSALRVVQTAQLKNPKKYLSDVISILKSENEADEMKIEVLKTLQGWGDKALPAVDSIGKLLLAEKSTQRLRQEATVALEGLAPKKLAAFRRAELLGQWGPQRPPVLVMRKLHFKSIAGALDVLLREGSGMETQAHHAREYLAEQQASPELDHALGALIWNKESSRATRVFALAFFAQAAMEPTKAKKNIFDFIQDSAIPSDLIKPALGSFLSLSQRLDGAPAALSQAILTLLQFPNAEVQKVMLQKLKQFPYEAPEVVLSEEQREVIVPQVVLLLSTSPSSDVRLEAAKILGEYAPVLHERSVPALIQTLDYPRESVVKAAARSLGAFGPHAVSAKETLERTYVVYRGRPGIEAVIDAALASLTGKPQRSEVRSQREQDFKAWLDGTDSYRDKRRKLETILLLLLDSEQLQQIRGAAPVLEYYERLKTLFPEKDKTELRGSVWRVVDGFFNTPRHLFAGPGYEDGAYEDKALSYLQGQTIPQPSLMAFMLTALDLKATDRVLEIGAGSGWLAAWMSLLVEHVDAIETIPALAQQARRNIALSLRSHMVEIMEGDGWPGLPERAPYDVIVLSADSSEKPEHLFRQLSPKGGRLIVSMDGVLKLFIKNGTDIQETILLENVVLDDLVRPSASVLDVSKQLLDRLENESTRDEAFKALLLQIDQYGREADTAGVSVLLSALGRWISAENVKKYLSEFQQLLANPNQLVRLVTLYDLTRTKALDGAALLLPLIVVNAQSDRSLSVREAAIAVLKKLHIEDEKLQAYEAVSAVLDEDATDFAPLRQHFSEAALIPPLLAHVWTNQLRRDGSVSEGLQPDKKIAAFLKTLDKKTVLEGMINEIWRVGPTSEEGATISVLFYEQMASDDDPALLPVLMDLITSVPFNLSEEEVGFRSHFRHFFILGLVPQFERGVLPTPDQVRVLLAMVDTDPDFEIRTIAALALLAIKDPQIAKTFADQKQKLQMYSSVEFREWPDLFSWVQHDEPRADLISVLYAVAELSPQSTLEDFRERLSRSETAMPTIFLLALHKQSWMKELLVEVFSYFDFASFEERKVILALENLRDGVAEQSFWAVPEREIYLHENAISALSVSADGRYLISADKDGKVFQSRVDTGQPEGRPLILDGPIYNLRADPDGSLWIVMPGSAEKPGGVSNSLKLLHVENPFDEHWKLVQAQTISLRGVWAHSFVVEKAKVVFSPEGQLAAYFAESDLPNVLILDTRNVEKKTRLKADAIAFYPGKQFLGYGHEDDLFFAVHTVPEESENERPEIKIGWFFGDVMNMPFVASFAAPPAGVRALVFNPNTATGQLLIIDKKGGLYLRNMAGQEMATIMGLTTGSSAVFSPDGRYFAIAEEDGRIVLWHAESGFQMAVFVDHTQPAKTLTFSPDGQWLYSASPETISWQGDKGYWIHGDHLDKTIRRWDLTAVKKRLRLQALNGVDAAKSETALWHEDLQKGKTLRSDADFEKRVRAARSLHQIGALIPKEIQTVFAELPTLGARQVALMAIYLYRVGLGPYPTLDSVRALIQNLHDLENTAIAENDARFLGGGEHRIALEAHSNIAQKKGAAFDAKSHTIKSLLELTMRVEGNVEETGALRVSPLFEDKGLEHQSLPFANPHALGLYRQVLAELGEAEDFHPFGEHLPSYRNERYDYRIMWSHFNFNGPLEGKGAFQLTLRWLDFNARLARREQDPKLMRPGYSGKYIGQEVRARNTSSLETAREYRSEVVGQAEVSKKPVPQIPNPWSAASEDKVSHENLARPDFENLAVLLSEMVLLYQNRTQWQEKDLRRWIELTADLPAIAPLPDEVRRHLKLNAQQDLIDDERVRAQEAQMMAFHDRRAGGEGVSVGAVEAITNVSTLNLAEPLTQLLQRKARQFWALAIAIKAAGIFYLHPDGEWVLFDQGVVPTDLAQWLAGRDLTLVIEAPDLERGDWGSASAFRLSLNPRQLAQAIPEKIKVGDAESPKIKLRGDQNDFEGTVLTSLPDPDTDMAKPLLIRLVPITPARSEQRQVAQTLASAESPESARSEVRTTRRSRAQLSQMHQRAGEVIEAAWAPFQALLVEAGIPENDEVAEEFFAAYTSVVGDRFLGSEQNTPQATAAQAFRGYQAYQSYLEAGVSTVTTLRESDQPIFDTLAPVRTEQIIVAPDRPQLEENVLGIVSQGGRNIERKIIVEMQTEMGQRIVIILLELVNAEQKPLAGLDGFKLEKAVLKQLIDTSALSKEVMLEGRESNGHGVQVGSAAILKGFGYGLTDVVYDIYAQLPLGLANGALEKAKGRLVREDQARLRSVIDDRLIPLIEGLHSTLEILEEQVEPILDFLQELEQQVLTMGDDYRGGDKGRVFRPSSVSRFLELLNARAEASSLPSKALEHIEQIMTQALQERFFIFDPQRVADERDQRQAIEQEIARFRASADAAFLEIENPSNGRKLSRTLLDLLTFVRENILQEIETTIARKSWVADEVMTQYILAEKRKAKELEEQARSDSSYLSLAQKRTANVQDLEAIFTSIILKMRGGYHQLRGEIQRPKDTGKMVLFARQINIFDLIHFFEAFEGQTLAIISDDPEATRGAHWVQMARNDFGVETLLLPFGTLDAVFNASLVGESVAVNMDQRQLYVRPSDETRAILQEQQADFEALRRYADVKAREPAVTQQGLKVLVRVSAERPEGIQDAMDRGADGGGLAKTEFMIEGEELEAWLKDPSKDNREKLIEFFRVQFSSILESADYGLDEASRMITIRAYDFERDKNFGLPNPDGHFGPDYYRTEKGRELLKIELIAKLRASRPFSPGRLRVLFPAFRAPADLAALIVKERLVADGVAPLDIDHFMAMAKSDPNFIHKPVVGLTEGAQEQINALAHEAPDFISEILSSVSSAEQDNLNRLAREDVDFMKQVFSEAFDEVRQDAAEAEQSLVRPALGFMIETLEGNHILPYLLEQSDFVMYGTTDFIISTFRHLPGISRDNPVYSALFNQLQPEVMAGFKKGLEMAAQFNRDHDTQHSLEFGGLLADSSDPFLLALIKMMPPGQIPIISRSPQDIAVTRLLVRQIDEGSETETDAQLVLRDIRERWLALPEVMALRDQIQQERVLAQAESLAENGDHESLSSDGGGGAVMIKTPIIHGPHPAKEEGLFTESRFFRLGQGAKFHFRVFTPLKAVREQFPAISFFIIHSDGRRANLSDVRDVTDLNLRQGKDIFRIELLGSDPGQFEAAYAALADKNRVYDFEDDLVTGEVKSRDEDKLQLLAPEPSETVSQEITAQALVDSLMDGAPVYREASQSDQARSYTMVHQGEEYLLQITANAIDVSQTVSGEQLQITADEPAFTTLSLGIDEFVVDRPVKTEAPEITAQLLINKLMDEEVIVSVEVPQEGQREAYRIVDQGTIYVLGISQSGMSVAREVKGALQTVLTISAGTPDYLILAGSINDFARSEQRTATDVTAPISSEKHDVFQNRQVAKTLASADSSESARSEVRSGMLPGFELRETAGAVTDLYYRPNYQSPAVSYRLRIIPHGTTDNNERNVFHGRRTNNEPSHLNEKGRAEALEGARALWQEMGADWSQDPAQFVFLQTGVARTEETARIYQKYFEEQGGEKFDVATLDINGINFGAEINFGLYDGLTVERIESQFEALAGDAARKYRAGDVLVQFPEGQGYADYMGQVFNQLVDDEVNRQYAGKTVILFGHGTFTNAADTIFKNSTVAVESSGKIMWRNHHLKRGFSADIFILEHPEEVFKKLNRTLPGSSHYGALPTQTVQALREGQWRQASQIIGQIADILLKTPFTYEPTNRIIVALRGLQYRLAVLKDSGRSEVRRAVQPQGEMDLGLRELKTTLERSPSTSETRADVLEVVRKLGIGVEPLTEDKHSLAEQVGHVYASPEMIAEELNLPLLEVYGRLIRLLVEDSGDDETQRANVLEVITRHLGDAAKVLEGAADVNYRYFDLVDVSDLTEDTAYALAILSVVRPRGDHIKLYVSGDEALVLERMGFVTEAYHAILAKLGASGRANLEMRNSSEWDNTAIQKDMLAFSTGKNDKLQAAFISDNELFLNGIPVMKNGLRLNRRHVGRAQALLASPALLDAQALDERTLDILQMREELERLGLGALLSEHFTQMIAEIKLLAASA